MKITIPHYETSEDTTGKKFTVFLVEVVGSRNNPVPRRYSEFVEFHDKLHEVAKKDKALMRKLPALPPKKFLFNMDPEFLKHRAELLEKYLLEVDQCTRTRGLESEMLRNFLNVDYGGGAAANFAQRFGVSPSTMANLPEDYKNRVDTIGKRREEVRAQRKEIQAERAKEIEALMKEEEKRRKEERKKGKKGKGQEEEEEAPAESEAPDPDKINPFENPEGYKAAMESQRRAEENRRMQGDDYDQGDEVTEADLETDNPFKNTRSLKAAIMAEGGQPPPSAHDKRSGGGGGGGGKSGGKASAPAEDWGDYPPEDVNPFLKKR